MEVVDDLKKNAMWFLLGIGVLIKFGMIAPGSATPDIVRPAPPAK